MKDRIGSNVIATNHLQADKIVKYDGGCEVWGASVMNINGSVPEFIKKKGAIRVKCELRDMPEGFVVHVVLTFLKRLCMDTVSLQSDGEPAITQLVQHCQCLARI